MKSRKTAHYNDLITEVTKHVGTQFLPTPIMIKQQIETLIDREYIERNKDDPK